MSGSLRDALEKLLAEWSELSTGYEPYRELRALLAAHPVVPADTCVVCGGSGFAAPSVPCGDSWHDAEDATLRAEPVGVSDEAVRAAARGMQPTAGNHQVNCPTYMLQPFSECTCGIWANAVFRARAALEAAAPLMGATPIASREQVEQVVRRVYIDGGAHITVAQEGAADIVDALLAAGVFREPPTREQIAEALSNATRNMDCKQWETPHGMLPFADAVLALMGGAEEETK